MRRVLFIGAGGSVPFHVPVTGEILPEAVLRLRDNRLFVGYGRRGPQDIDDEKFLAAGLHALYPGIRLSGTKEKLTAALPYITDVLSLLDYLVANEQPLKPRWDRAQLSRLRMLFDRALCEVLAPPLAGPAGPRDRLKKYLRAQIVHSFDHLAVITTNYDLTLDTALGEVADGSRAGLTKIDLGFEYRDVSGGNLLPRPRPPARASKLADRLALYKLHGSLNYLRCEVCDQMYMNPSGDISYLAFKLSPSSANTCHCGHGPLRHVIVAPSTVRSYRIPQVLSTWAAATEALRQAEEWIFAGYSLPGEDLAIRSMLFRAWHARGQIANPKRRIDLWKYRPRPRITVVQNSARAKPAYNLLFGKIDYREGGFENWLPA